MSVVEVTRSVEVVPRDPFRDKFYEAALEHCNLIRRHYGLDEVSHVYPGRANSRHSCPIAETLKAHGGSRVYYDVNVGNGGTYVKARSRQRRQDGFNHSPEVRTFVTRVDRKEYPELEVSL